MSTMNSAEGSLPAADIAEDTDPEIIVESDGIADTMEVEEPELEDTSHIHSFLQEIFSYNSLVHAFSGATGSVTALSTFYPLDSVRTRLQVEDKRKSQGTFKEMKRLYQEEGLASFYRGILPVLQSLYCSNFVYFYTYHGLKAAFRSKGVGGHSALDLALGYLSGIINAMVTTPLWVVNTRMKLQGAKLQMKNGNVKEEYKGLIDGLIKISKHEGFSSLWSGVQGSFLLAGNPAIHFMVYEGIKRFLLKTGVASSDKKLSSFHYFLIGGLAKAVATILTYPIQLAQCRQRAGRSKGTAKTSSIIGLLSKMFREQGFLSLFRGLETKLFQTVLTAALMFLAYEKIASFIFSIMRATPKKKLH